MLVSMVLSAVSGLAWGLIGYWLASDTDMAGGAWVGLVASPVIGMCIGVHAIRAKPTGYARQALFALLQLYLAVALFAAAVGVWHVTVGWKVVPFPLQSGGRWRAFMNSVGTALFGFTVTGWVLLFWPVSIANHMLIWTRSDTGARRVQPGR